MMPAGGGKPVVLPVTAQRRLWGVNENGLVVVTPGEQDALDLFPLGEGPMRRLGRLPFRIPREFPGITFSRDGRWALTNQTGRRESDLMMIENFR